MRFLQTKEISISSILRTTFTFTSSNIMEVCMTRRSLFTIYVTFVLSFMILLPTSRSAAVITLGNHTDRSALLALKDRITSDPFGALRSWNKSVHHCSWIGVTCSSPGRVTMLNMSSQGLVGTISPYIGNLSFLQSINLNRNDFTGEIPQQVGRLFRLQELRLANNSLNGEIPSNLSSCTQLRYLFLTGNELVGKIPTHLGSLSKLVVLEMSSNYLEGTIPVSLSNISTLAVLSMQYNSLDGNVPSELGTLSRLQFFGISANNLSGTIPPQLFNISTIYYFAVAANQFHGALPSYIGNTLPNLETMFLGLNKFSGSLPYSISNASGLHMLDVSHNHFSGLVPPNLGSSQSLIQVLNFGHNQLGTGELDDLRFIDSLSNCTHLKVLAMNDNNFTGKLPDSIANLSTELSHLYMGSNRLFGKIPAVFENFVSLNGLALENNLLTGSIPVSIGKLPNLIVLSMSVNKLSGEIPSNIGNNTLLEQVHLADNSLAGQIPPSLSSCLKMQNLDLSQNRLTGTIPNQLFGLSSLSTSLNLSQNLLTGTLPLEVGNLEKVTILDLSGNQLSGNIPGSLEKCVGLEILNLQGNSFEGIIPPSLKSLKSIQALDLSKNRLSGPIPEYLESFVSLEYLNLSSNEFEGEVPKQGIFKNTSAFSILGNSKLCGGNPFLNLPSCPRRDIKKQNKHFPLKKLLLVIFGAVLCIIIVCLFLLFFWRKRANSNPSFSSSRTLLDDMFHKVSYKELLKATDGFSDRNLVGVGSYGSVYKGLLTLNHGTGVIVAVKVIDLQRRGASKSFTAECEALRSIRHRNLLKILTSCSTVDYKGNDFRALVFEFMPNGSLENWLHPTTKDGQFPMSSRRSLSFMERLNVAIDVASALDYLHHGCQTPIVHCDLKPSNILLDDDMNSHVGDFGLAKFLGGVIVNVDSQNHTNVDSKSHRQCFFFFFIWNAEYGMGREVSTHGDVYSFGIMLLEMFTGKRPTDGMFEDGFSLHNVAKTALHTDGVVEIVDPAVLVHLHPRTDDAHYVEILLDHEMETKLCEALTGIVKLGVLCSVESPKERMDMVQVLKELQLIKIHVALHE